MNAITHVQHVALTSSPSSSFYMNAKSKSSLLSLSLLLFETSIMGILNGNIPLNSLRFQDDNLPSDTSIEQVHYARSLQSAFVF